MSVTRIHPRTVPFTEAQVCKARYDEAVAIKDAWEHRLRIAHLEHRDAIAHGGDTDATARNIRAVTINHADAAGELRIALDQWANTTERRTA